MLQRYFTAIYDFDGSQGSYFVHFDCNKILFGVRNTASFQKTFVYNSKSYIGFINAK
jgi:hypothetical protein